MKKFLILLMIGFCFSLSGQSIENSREFFRQGKTYKAVQELFSPVVKEKLDNPWEYMRGISVEYLDSLENSLEIDFNGTTIEKYIGLGELAFIREDFVTAMTYMEILLKKDLPTWERLVCEWVYNKAKRFVWWQNPEVFNENSSLTSETKTEIKPNSEVKVSDVEEENELSKEFNENFLRYKNEFYVSPEDD